MEGFKLKKKTYYVKDNGDFYKVWMWRSSKKEEAFKIDESEFEDKKEEAYKEFDSREDFPDFVIEKIREKYDLS